MGTSGMKSEFWLVVLVSMACFVAAVMIAPAVAAVVASRSVESWWRVKFGVDLPLYGGWGWTTRCMLMRGHGYYEGYQDGRHCGGDPWLAGRVRREAAEEDDE